ncbi:MAG: chloride channel protein [Kiritimatiellia bacterium]|jgi:CIC family chloride channel protein
MSALKRWLDDFRNEPATEGLGILRTLVLSAIVGLVAGLGAVALVSLLQLAQWFFLGVLANYVPPAPAGDPVMFHNLPEVGVGEVRRWVILLLPMVGGLVSSAIVLRFAPEAEGHGTDAAIEAYHFRGGKVRPAVPPVKAIATALVIGTGGSAGCEGPITQIGSGFGSAVASLLGLSVRDRRVLMAAGMGAGVGALFHAPMAGALFAAEVLYRDLDFEYEVLVPSVIASVSGHAIFSKVFGFHALFETPENIFHRPKMLLLYIVLAVILAGGARFYTWSFYQAHDAFKRLKMPRVLKPALGGLLTGIVGFFFLPAIGSGYGVIQEALRYEPHFAPGEGRAAFMLLAGVFVLKTLTTSFTVGSGGSGGIFGPAIVVGGALGGAAGIAFSALLPSWNVPVGAFTLVGMVAFFGCAAKTPISTILMVGEMTGNYRLLVPSMWVCIIAYMLSRKVSLYRSQLANRFEAPIHRGRMISGVLHSITVRQVLEARESPAAFVTVRGDTPLDDLVDVIASGGQTVFPVVGSDGLMTGIVSRNDLRSVLPADPALRQTLMVDDLTVQRHAVVTEGDVLNTVLRLLDSEDAEDIVVAAGPARNQPIGIVSHNDIVDAYQREMRETR